MATFFDAAYPTEKIEEMELVSWGEVMKLFFEAASAMEAAAKRSGIAWKQSSVVLLDQWLEAAAATGRWEGMANIPPECAQEMWRRWQYVIIGSGLEEKRGEPLNLPVIKAAPPGMKAWAIVLYMLGGPGRAYRRELFDRH